MIAFQIISGNRDVVLLDLIPDQDLLGALCACALVSLAPDGSLGGGNRSGRDGVCDHALETLHVNVRLATTVRNLEMSVN